MGFKAHFLYEMVKVVNEFSDKIETLVTPIVKAMGYDLWGIKSHRSGKKDFVTGLY